ncbi:STAS-like domain-containing protein [Flavobacterium sp.]|uniref:STAS-like domain-containing protein n=1 Tax=Flavobacterium sp. TaxID=239 RepID=UPI0040480A48
MDSVIIFVKDFSIVPGSRELDEGKKAHSGEEFRNTFLEPAFKKILDKDTKLIVNLDGTIGYGTSWLEEVFGGLARIYGSDVVKNKIELISEEEPYLIDDINEYINDAQEF